MVMVPRPKTEPPPEDVARRESRRAIVKYLVKRHHKSLEILAAYDRGEIDRDSVRRKHME
ncbi:MAG: hypothetical protein AB7P40_06105 [Chloroflexota bacterium]